MLELDTYPKRIFKELMLSPEEARDEAVKILRSVHYNEELLKAEYLVPLEEITHFNWEMIADINKREKEVRDFAALFEDGLAEAYNADRLGMLLNP